MADYTKIPNLAPSVQNGRRLNKRSAYVEYYKAETGMLTTLVGLNIRFDVEENAGNFYPKASIGVCNPSPETRDFLTNYMNFAKLKYLEKNIMLYAGYLTPKQDWEDTPFLFGGNVIYTRFSDPPDIWMDMEVIYNNAASSIKSIEWTHAGTASSKEILTECAEKLSVGIDIRDDPNLEHKNFTASGDGQQLMRQLRMTFPKHAVFISNGKLVVIKNERDAPAPGETVWEMRADTGIPIVETWGVEVQCLLNPSIHPGDWINLYSLHQPAANGKYRILRVNHRGELRGNEFVTRIEAFYPAGDR